MRGIGDENKRRRVYNQFRKFEGDICLIQEAHCTTKVNVLWENQWGHKVLASNGSSNTCGVMTLFNKKLSNSVKDIVRDMEGRYIICKIEINNYSFCIANIYAPNEDRPDFFDNIFTIVKNMDCVYNIIGGDFNTVINAQLDRKNGMTYHKRHMKKLMPY